MKKIVLTGAPHSGKTSLLQYLRADGHKVCEEAAALVLETLGELVHSDHIRIWRDKYLDSFQHLIIQTQLDNEKQYAPKDGEIVFFDRGALDAYAFSRFFGKNVHPDIEDMVRQCKYNHVFVLELVTPYSNRHDTGRTESEEDSRILHNLFIETYKEHGYNPILVPLMSYQERARFIYDHLSREPNGNNEEITIERGVV